MYAKINDLIKRFPELQNCRESILTAFETIKQTFCSEGTLFTCGNGGSAADAEHMVGELMKGFMLSREVTSLTKSKLQEQLGDQGLELASKLQEGLPAVSLNGHPSLATAFGNDVDFEMVFAQQIYVMGKAGDVILGFTTSGNSVNVLNALKIANAFGIKTIAMTGKDGGECDNLAECCIKIPETETYKVQELHLPVYHALCLQLEEEFYGG